MKKIFTILSAMLLSVSAFAALNYGSTLTQNDFNDNTTVISKIIPDGSEVVWDNGQIRCGGTATGAFSGPAWNWDDKGVVIALAAGVPNQLSFQYATNNTAATKRGTDWSAPDWYVDESENGSTWTNAWTTNSNSKTFASQTVNLKTTTRYIRLYYSGNFAGYFKNIKVTEQILMGTPDPESLDFGTVKVDDAVDAKTFTINYTGMVPTASSSDAHFTVTPESFGSLYDYKVTQTITVGLLTNEAGEFNGTVTVAGRNDKSATVAVSAKVEKYDQTINWDPAESVDFGGEIALATATSGLDVTYEIENPAILKFEGGKFVTLYAGETKVTAKQAGNYKYNAAEDVEKTITVVAPTTYGDFSATTCDEAVEFNETKYEESFAGDVTVGKNYMGGDSIVHVAIVINHATFDETSMTIEQGAQETWNEIDLSTYEVGPHDIPFYTTNAAGCDSTITLHLTVTKQGALVVPVELTFCEGGSVEFHGKEYTEAGTDVINAEGELRDTTYNVTIIELKKSYDEAEMTIEVGAEETWNEIDLSTYEVGSHNVEFATTNAAGCDSIVTLHLTVTKLQTLEEPYAIEFCEGDSAEFHGKWYFEEGEDQVEAEGEIRDTLYLVTITVHEVPVIVPGVVEVVAGEVVTLPEGEWILGEETVSGEYQTQPVSEVTTLDFYRYAETEFGCEYIDMFAVLVTPNYEAIENVNAEGKAVKFFQNGVLYIRRGNSIYTATGEKVE